VIPRMPGAGPRCRRSERAALRRQGAVSVGARRLAATAGGVAIVAVATLVSEFLQDWSRFPPGSFEMRSPPDEPGREGGEGQRRVIITRASGLDATR
jgi:hypothetical protein